MKSTLLLLLAMFTASVSAETTIVITATGLEQSQSVVPGNTDVLHAEDLRKKGYTKATDVLRQLPGVSVSSSGGAGQQASVFMRGTNSNHTLVMRDGIVLQDPSSPTGAYDFSNLDLESVERIEIIKGPLSSLYGSSAIGGVIHIISKKGSRRRQGWLNVNTGSQGLIATETGMRGSLSENLKYSLSIAHAQSGGESAVFHKEDYGGKGQIKDDDGYEKKAFHSLLNWRLSKAFDFELQADFQQTETEIDGFDENGIIEDPDAHIDQKTNQLQAKLNYRSADGRWSSLLRLSQNNNKRQAKNERQSPLDSEIDTTYEGKRRDLEWRLNYIPDEYRHLSLISWYGDEQMQAWGRSVYGGSNGDYIVDENTDAKTHRKGLAMQLYWGRKHASSIISDIRLEKEQSFPTELTWRLALNKGFAGHRGTLYVHTGTAFKTPSLYERYGHSVTNYGSSYTGNPDLEPEKSRSLELGIDYAFRAVPVKLGFNLYKTTIKNLIETTYDAAFNSTSINKQKSRIKGAELTLDVKMAKKTNLSFNLSYIDSRDAKSNKQLLRRPRVISNLHLNHKINDRLELFSDIHSVSKRVDIHPVNGSRINPGDYSLWDFGLNYQLTASVKLHGRINNLLNKDYQPVAGYQGEGRNVLLGLSYSQ